MDIDLTSYLPPISIKAEPLFDISTPLGHFTFTNSMLYTLIVIGVLALFFALATRRMSMVPKGSQNFAEAIVEMLLGITEGTAGKRVGRRIFPLIATLFIFILIANYAGLLPGVGTIGFCAKHHTEGTEEHALVLRPAGLSAPLLDEEPKQEEQKKGGLPQYEECKKKGADYEFVPFLRAPNADLNTTLAMALLAVGIVQIAGIASHGLGGYIKELTTPIFLAPIHIIGEISRVISLSFRLFGNIFGGEVLVTVMYALLGSVFFGIGAFIFLGLELLFGLIQALIFSILTLVYIATAVGGHGSHDAGHGDHDDAHHGPTSPAEELGHKIADTLTGHAPRPGEKVPGTEPKSGTERHMG
jgi:F-type H+-transporting ATPase subunit a